MTGWAIGFHAYTLAAGNAACGVFVRTNPNPTVMKPFAVARTRDNLLRDAEAYGAEIRSSVRLTASLVAQEYDLEPGVRHAFRLEYELDEDTGAPCSIALYLLNDSEAEEDEDDLDDDEI